MTVTDPNFSRNGKYNRSGRHNPCPICGRVKDQDCRWNIEVALCHTHIDQDVRASGYVYRGATKDGMWGQYFPVSESEKKPVRPKSKREFVYYDAAGTPLVKVTRYDKGDGNKSFPQFHWDGKSWVKGLTDEVKSQIHLYRIQDAINQGAIAKGEPILVVEGEGKVDLLLLMGIAATCSIGGAKKWRHYGYPNYLEDLAGANVVLCPDRDTVGLEHCEDIARDFPNAKWLYAFPDSPLWERLPKKGGLDIADWIADGASRQDILGAIGEQRQELHESPDESDQPGEREDDEDKPCRLARQFQEVQAVLGQRLRLNTLKLQIELDGEPVNPDRVPLKLANDFNLQISRCNALDIVTELAEQRSYSPVVEYLTQVYDRYKGNTSILNNLASSYFGTDNPIYNTYLLKTLVAAVARAMQPGCKMDTALILQGKQGVGKSSFFKVLASEDWFDDSLGSHISDKDERLKLHVTWFIEWAELESVFKRRDLASVKAFLTCSRDYIRPPYGRSVQAFARPSIIVGTTNQDEFLSDSTGNRRFWVIPVQKGINLHQLQQERDRIWAAAVTLYKAGESWWLSQSEQELSSAMVSEYQMIDPWQEAIAKYVAGFTVMTTEEILRNCIHLELDKQSKEAQMRVANILKQLEWRRERKRVDGKPKWIWVL